ncbi:carnitine O-palmitoyltransferase 1, liver isoform isoform X1 [Nasonia vitripennis]|uniref:carnitine O-palmitoyltransferase n=1 Tax=Nasonia vitripennis TaxID=7425 RepID=A0A7M7TAB8_NASVI|nr:carnitine O-palmitoyltransferase 1, liver isoform isoform X1 [Nasonia vitripennis]XP_031786749.1 carnitine O-palmitoyltransferase 1, liver isoform isoform X1 [Nasonia vitripennis]XP_031786751.1 carnitine O-palmitoyltransferase 1, liver isoform isoform X1 [Nasonia vitripennis]XP_032452091.1 carnitine O-palmitoyltransferase 1, liver isoform isoform X1 [Nasonia vitripennis]
MAEAHSAVAFSFSITHEGWDVNFDREVLNLIWQSGIRSWKKRYFRFHNNIKSGVYPASLGSLWLTVIVVTAIHFAGYKVPYDPVGKVVPYLFASQILAHLAGCFVVGLLLWLVTIYAIRYVLKLLLMYKGWMYESRGPGSSISIQTKLWARAVKIFSGWHKPMLYSFQGSLPRLPLPSVHDTMQRYLRSARPLLDDENYKRMERLASEFEAGIGVKLQRYLILKSWWATNYVSDWWEEYVYLRGRSPIMVNSNFYGIDAILMHPTKLQSARAASVIHSCLQYRRLIERQSLEPILVQGLVPLCSWQYERLFNTTRIPGIEADKIIHIQDSKHIVVYHKGKYFRLPIYHKNRLLQPCEIEVQIQSILDDKSTPYEGEEKLASLTAGERTHWAKTREEYFSKGINKQSLDAIEKSAFVVALDDVPYEFDKAHPEKLDNYGRILLHGKGYDRWFDKSFTLCIGNNGRIGFNAEHSWADAAVMSHLWEVVIMDEAPGIQADAPIMGTLWEFAIGTDVEVGYKEDGHTKGTPEFTPPAPSRLQWDLNPKCLEAIETSYLVAEELVNGVDLRIYVHDLYGKGFMKKSSMSPDAFIQMALQLAYYRDTGKFSLTYEASMTRLFREGRTETVRPCTIESAAWVKAMESKSSTVEEKHKLLMAAAAQHQRGYQNAMSGKGIDRHLFCLYVVSKYLEVDSPFLKEVLSEPWRLSTSQTPHGQTSKLDLKKYPDCISAGGGFGPVADDGYGVSYIIAGENMIFFHISSKDSSPATDSKRFAETIKTALMDMKNLFLEKKKLQSQANGLT